MYFLHNSLTERSVILKNQAREKEFREVLFGVKAFFGHGGAHGFAGDVFHHDEFHRIIFTAGGKNDCFRPGYQK